MCMHSSNIVLQYSAVFLLFCSSQSQTANQYCNDDMTACTCPEIESVCYFELVIQRLLTFTRYVHDTPFGSAGKSYYINDTGELEHVSFSPDRTGCNATNCTQANTADGLTYRTFIGINDRLPGPTLVVYEGQTLVVKCREHATKWTYYHPLAWHDPAQYSVDGRSGNH